jgi:hypothetical protein
MRLKCCLFVDPFEIMGSMGHSPYPGLGMAYSKLFIVEATINKYFYSMNHEP